MTMADPRILVVDDDEAVAQLLAAVLRREGWEAQVCTDGAQALSVLQSSAFDLVVTDVTMPGMSGPQLVEAAAARGLHPPFIVMSAYVDPAREALLRGAPGVRSLIRKPFEIAQVAARVREALGVPRRADYAPAPGPGERAAD